MKKMKKRYERYKRGAEMQRDEVEDRVESMGVKAWGEQIATQKNLNKHFGTPSKRTTPNIFSETPSPERLRESGAPRNPGNLARMFTADFASVSEPSDETLAKLAMEKLKMNGSVPFSRKPGPSRYLRQYQKNKLNQLIQKASERKAQAPNEEERAKINKKLRKNLEKLKKSIRGGKKRSVRRSARSSRRSSPNRRRSSPNRRRSSPNRRRSSPNRRRSARGGKRSARNRRRSSPNRRRKLAGKEFNLIRKYLDNMPMPLKVAFPGYVLYHIATDKEAFF
jgi:hypothetical protein